MSDFLADGERAQFAVEAFPRLLQAIGRDGRPVSGKQADIGNVVRSYATRIRSGSLRGFHCIGIAGAYRDGITWAAATAADALSASAPDVETVLVRDVARAGSIPEIMRIMPRRHVAAAARRSGVTRSLRMTSPWVATVIVVAAILAAAGVTLLTAWNRSAINAGFTNTITWISAVALAAATFVWQQLGTWLKLDPSKPLVAKLVEEVDRQAGSTAYEDFVEQLAASWITTKKRHVVVDTFANIDSLTRKVLEWYFHHHVSLTDPAELWVVYDAFEPPSTSSFANLVERERQRRRMAHNASNSSKGVRRTDLYEMLELTRRQRTELAESRGVPHRAGFRRVKDIVSTAKDDIKLLVDNLMPSHTAERDLKKFAAFELLYVLAIDSAVGAHNWLWSHLTTTLSSTSVDRSNVLRLLLSHGGIGSGQLKSNLQEIKKEFGALIEIGDPSGPDTLLVNPAIGDLLAEEWSTRKLIDPDLVHLFWGLYWFDRGGGQRADVLMTNRAAEHLARSSLPTAYRRELGAELDAVLDHMFDALVTTASACLRFCTLHRVVSLLQLAHELISERPLGLSKHGRSWPRLVRDAYTVLGDDRLLEIMFDLESEPTQQKALGYEPISESLTTVFLESIDGRHSHIDVSATGIGVGRLHSLPLHASARGAWVALSLQAFASIGTPLLTASADLARRSMEQLGQSAVAALSGDADATDSLAHADVMALTLTLWCWAWSGDPSRLPEFLNADSEAPDAAAMADVLETSYLIAGELCKTRFAPQVVVNDLDFVLDCLAEELLTIVAATALYVLARWPKASTTPYTDQLEDILASALADLGLEAPDEIDEALIRTNTAQKIEGRLSLLQVVFRRLGFVQLADHLNVRTEQLTLFQLRDETSISSGMAENMQRPGVTGMLANAVQAERVRIIGELSAELVVHSAKAAIAGRLGDDLTSQLCISAMRAAHSYDTNCSDLIDYLLSPHSRMPETSRLHRQFAVMSSEALNHVALSMENIALSLGEVAEPLIEEMRDRIASSDDPSQLQRAVEVLDIYDYRRAAKLGRVLDVEAVLDQWRERTTSMHYPYVLCILLRQKKDSRSGRLTEAVAETLSKHKDYLSVSGIVLLAYTAASKLSTVTDLDQRLVTEVLRVVHNSWEANLSAQYNLAILKILRDREQGRCDFYTTHIAHWVKVQLELDEQRRLPTLLERGRWALLLLDYCSLFASFGLPAITDRSAALDLNVEPAGLLRRLEEQPMPEPLISSDKQHVLNQAFYDRAVLLFEGVLRDDPAADDIRAEYDDAVRAAMPDFYRLLGELDGVPRAVKSILDRHQRFVEDRLLKSGDI